MAEVVVGRMRDAGRTLDFEEKEGGFGPAGRTIAHGTEPRRLKKLEGVRSWGCFWGQSG